MLIFELPVGLTKVAHFTLPRVQTWGNQKDAEHKEMVRRASALTQKDEGCFEWFVFCIRCTIGESRGKRKRQVPDVENIPNLIVDAFTGILYPDDNLHHVRGVQVEARWGADDEEKAEIWIYGQSKESSDARRTTISSRR